MVLRWLANANYEVAYHGQVYLFDVGYTRFARNRPLGFEPRQVARANLILIGHAHFDHIMDIVPVARQTNAKVVGDTIGIENAVSKGLPRDQAIVVKGGESLKLGDVTVDVGLAQHAVTETQLSGSNPIAGLYRQENGPLTAEEAASDATLRANGAGSSDPAIRDKGTLAYVLTFPNGFKVLHLSSGGPVTDGDKALEARVGSVDVAIIAYQARATSRVLVGTTFPLVQLFRPRLYLPAHHDAAYGTWLDLGLEPLFEKIRSELPNTHFVAPLYRSPIFVETKGPHRGDVVKFKY